MLHLVPTQVTAKRPSFHLLPLSIVSSHDSRNYLQSEAIDMGMDPPTPIGIPVKIFSIRALFMNCSSASTRVVCFCNHWYYYYPTWVRSGYSIFQIDERCEGWVRFVRFGVRRLNEVGLSWGE